MEQVIGYYPTGDVIYVDDNPIMTMLSQHVSDRWFVATRPALDNLEFGVIDLEDKEGSLTLNDANWFSIPLDRNLAAVSTSETLYGDKFLVSVWDYTAARVTQTLVLVHLDENFRYEIFQNIALGTPLGIEGRVFYTETPRGISGVNLDTMEAEFEIELQGETLYEPKHLRKIYDGNKVVLTRLLTGDRSFQVTSIPEDRVYLQINGIVGGFNISENGVFCKDLTGGQYYRFFDFGGEVYNVVLEPNNFRVPVTAPRITIISDSGASIWVSYKPVGRQDRYFVKYQRADFRRQKSARKVVN